MSSTSGFSEPTYHRTPDPDFAEPPAAKRRKVRKGTRSCWECKRRKVRCNFTTEDDTVCISCRQRGAKCVSQEFPEVSAPADRGRQMDRIVRVEALLEKLAKSVATGAGTGTAALPDTGIPTPSSSTSELPQVLALCESPDDSPQDEEHHSAAPESSPNRDHSQDGTLRIAATNPASSSRYEAMSEALCAAFPSPEDLEILRDNGAVQVTSFNQMVTVPLSVLEERGVETSDVWFKLPDRRQHPVITAKHMMMLVTTLQGLYPSTQSTVPGLSEHPLVITRRLADTARNLVTNNEEFIGTIEGLECIMYEGMYQANWGNLRRSWLTFRRAMMVAQLMGLHRPHIHKPLKMIDPKAPVYPQYLWYRIVFADRALSMMLGLPQGTLDRSMADPAQLASDVPSGRLERIQCMLSARILERNESDPSKDDYTEAKAIDSELQKAAKMMAGKWWLAPNLLKAANDPRAMFWESLRLSKQLYHFYLLIQLHLPYMLLSDIPGSGETGRFEYSKATCVTASREILSRFVVYRSFNRAAFCCRNIDLFALMAAMTLLLAYLDGHRKQGGKNILAHQRISDRAMMEEVLENMECVSKLNDDVLSDKCGNLMRRLLAIEEAAAEGHGRDSAAKDLDENIETALRISVPYYGTVKIDSAGVISKDGPSQQQSCSREPLSGLIGHNESAWGCGLPGLQGADTAVQSSCFNDGVHAQVEISHATADFRDDGGGLPSQQAGISLEFENSVNDDSVQFDIYPPLTAGMDDWTLQGVDMAYFDTLMRGAGVPDAEDWGALRS